MTTLKFLRLVSRNDDILAHLTALWVTCKSEYKKDPVTCMVIDSKFGICALFQLFCMVFGGMLGWAFAPLLHILFTGREVSHVLLESYGVWSTCLGSFLMSFQLSLYVRFRFGKDRPQKAEMDNAVSFFRGITILATHAKDWESLADEQLRRKIARTYLFQGVEHVVWLQSVLWRKKEAEAARSEFIKDLFSLSPLAGTSDNPGEYFPLEKRQQFKEEMMGIVHASGLSGE